MKVIEARNVHEALAKGIWEIQRFGVPRDSRNGSVLVMPTPVTTVYHQPEERVVFWPQRDANPFFHLYEALWMLAGKEKVEPLLRYTKRMADYADNGVMHGAYGHRWRYTFGKDQLNVIIDRLMVDQNDRRSVLQMWDTRLDLNRQFKDLPCNVTASFQRDIEGNLDLTVFCRSNDIIWGAYGANAVHFSMLQEYVARGIGCKIGRYYQVSVNWHAYVNVLEKVLTLGDQINNPYKDSNVFPTLMPNYSATNLDFLIRRLVEEADNGFKEPLSDNSNWAHVVHTVLKAHHIYKTSNSAQEAIGYLNSDWRIVRYDWIVAAREWLERRKK